jgi:hypothetical protein
MKFFYGIEHEVAFINREGKFADFSNTTFADFDKIISALPEYPRDYPQLRIGDAGIKRKRWYIEGFERFLDSEKPYDCVPKGVEIRTTIHDSIHGVISELTESLDRLRNFSSVHCFSPVLISFNPYYKEFKPAPPLNGYEIRRRQGSPEKQTAQIPMVTYGPDLNISMSDSQTEQVIDVGRKLTYYSPFIVPFSFSAPFFGGDLWDGLSVRTYVRTGARPAAMVFTHEPEKMIMSKPSLMKRARIDAEIGRIEFKAFDSCDDFSIYAGLFALLKGLILDQSLPGRATVPDAKLHQLSARKAFDDEGIYLAAMEIIEAVRLSLANDPDVELLAPLEFLLSKRKTPAHKLIEGYKATSSIEATLNGTYK